MQAVILAAGRGTRMNRLTENVPKPLLAAGRMSLLEWKLEALPPKVTEAVVVVGYLGDQIRKRFGRRAAGRKIAYIEQKELNGTGGALFLAKGLIEGGFLALMGDDIYGDEDLAALADNGWSLLAQKASGPVRGAKIISNGGGAIKEIVEGAELEPGDWNNAGAYALGPEIFDYPLAPKSEGSEEFGLPQTIALAAADFPIKIVPAKLWIQITSPEDLARAEAALAAGRPTRTRGRNPS